MICPNCNGDLYKSSELARAHAELLEAGRSVSVSCAYCESVHVRRPEATAGSRRAADRYAGDEYDSRDDIQGAYAPARRNRRRSGGHSGRDWDRDGENDGQRRVSPLLGVGILIFPYIFAWFTLQPGYSIQARAISLGWFAVLILSSTA